MPKHKQYDDDFRASCVLMLEAAGYSADLDVRKKGALTAVAKNVGVPARTLSRWFNKENNPPPDRLVKEKRGELVRELENMAFKLLQAMGQDIDANGIDAARAGTALGIVIDKVQLLTGGATESNQTTVTIKYDRDYTNSTISA